jgi:agmatine deiminase
MPAQDEEDGGREVRGVDWEFNAYGRLYEPFDQDELVARKVLEVENVRRYRAPLVMEGGSFHVDGEGTCLVTEECLLHPTRNPQLSKEEIEGHLKEYLNVEKVGRVR